MRLQEQARSSSSPVRESARERLLVAADELFQTEGIHQTGIMALIERADVAKASFYASFDSKNDLIDAYLERQHDDIIGLLNAIAAADDSLEDKISSIFDLIRNYWVQASYRGCLFVVAQVELPQSEFPPKKWARIHKLEVLSILGRILERFGHPDPVEAAEQLSVILDGTLVAAAIRPDCDAFERGRSMALALLTAPIKASDGR